MGKLRSPRRSTTPTPTTTPTPSSAKKEPSMYGLTELEVSILKQIRVLKFKFFIEEKAVNLNEILKYKIQVNNQYVSLSAFPWEKYLYMVKLSDPSVASYTLEIANANDLKTPEEKVYVQLDDGRRYSFRNMMINIFEIKNTFGQQIPTYNIPDPVEISNPPPASKPILAETPAPSRIREMETKLDQGEETVAKISKEDLIYYISEKIGNRYFDEKRMTETEDYIRRMDRTFLYEKAFVDPSNYTSSAVSILFCVAPFYFHYPNFYQLNGYTMTIGVIGMMMCYNQLISLYGDLLANSQLGNLLMGASLLFYLLFFLCLNKINHLSLFFLSVAIIYTLMNYVLKIIVSSKFGKERAVYRENTGKGKGIPPNTPLPKMQKVCAEMVKRYGLHMTSDQFYQYVSFYDLEEKDKKFRKSETTWSLLLPVLSILVLYFLGGFLSKRQDLKILNREGREDPDHALHLSPLLGFNEIGMNVVTDQSNYDLPKELNLSSIMQDMMAEIQEEVIKKKDVHHYEKTMMKEDITKNTEKHLRRFLRYVFEDYLPVFTYHEESEATTITLSRKDNRYDGWDGSYNSVQQVLDKHKLIQFESHALTQYLMEVSQGRPLERSQEAMQGLLRKIILLQVWNKDLVQRYMNEASCIVQVGEDAYHAWKDSQINLSHRLQALRATLAGLESQVVAMDNMAKKGTFNDPVKAQMVQQEYVDTLTQIRELENQYQGQEAEMAQYYVDPLDERRLQQTIYQVQVSFVPNLFTTLIEKIVENRRENDLDKKNEALDKVQYKFKDIYDYFTNEEVFSDHEQRTFIAIVEKHLQTLFQTLYQKRVQHPSNVITDGYIPNSIKSIGRSGFAIILRILSTYILLGKTMGSAWWTAKSTMGSEDLIKSYGYEGNFGDIWRWVSMGVDTYAMDRKILEYKDVLEEKKGGGVVHYALVALLFFIYTAILGVYNNMVFGMVMTPVWTNAPVMVIALMIVFYLFYPKRWVLYLYVALILLLIIVAAITMK